MNDSCLASILLSSVSLLVSIISYIYARMERDRYDEEDIEADTSASRHRVSL